MPKRILIVEDTADLLAHIVELLRMEGYLVTAVSNGREALKLLAKIQPDLIITDLLMPEMNGFDFIGQVRGHAIWNKVPILVFSAMPPHENEKKVLELGANSYLKKPATLETLIEAVNKLINQE